MSGQQDKKNHGSPAAASDWERLAEASNLTTDQLLFWVGQKIYSDVPLYNRPFLFTIPEALEPGCFTEAFQALVNNSDALRMTIHEVDGVPRYEIRPTEPYSMDIIDLSDEIDPDKALHKLTRKRALRMFDFEERLFDTALFKIDAHKSVWYLNQHHIVSDGVTTVMIVKYLSSLYGQMVDGLLPPRIDIPQFADHIARARAYRGTEQFHKTETYWRRKLADLQNMPSSYEKSSAELDTQAERIVCKLGSERSEKLKLVAKQEGNTLDSGDATFFNIFTMLLTVYLHRSQGDEKIVLAAPFHNRRTPEERQIIGLLMQTLPLQVMIDPGDTFVSLLHKTRTEVIGTLSHRPYASPQMSRSYNAMVNYRVGEFRFNEKPIHSQQLHLGRAQKSLQLQIRHFEQTGEFMLIFDLLCSEVTADQRQQIPQHYLQLLDAFLENPHQEIQRANMLTPEERRKILGEWSSGGRCDAEKHAPVPERCVHELIEAQAKRKPDQLAAVCGKERLTYGILNEKANQLARMLLERGVTKGSYVPVLMPACLDLLISYLSIMKCGAAFVPLDPDWPERRIGTVLSALDAPVILIRRGDAGVSFRRMETVAPQVVVDHRQLALGATDLRIPMALNDPMYVIFTSGSTGTPKGVINHHAGAVNRFIGSNEDAERFRVENVIVLNTSAAVFDPSIRQLLWPLTCGGRTIIPQRDVQMDLDYLLELIVAEGVTSMSLVASVFNILVERLSSSTELHEKLAPMRHVQTGGEQVNAKAMYRFKELFPNINLAVIYGPSEAAIGVISHTVTRPPSGRLPIGRPYPNVYAYILNDQLEPVPAAYKGELCIGGVQVGLGYLNEPEATRAAFVPNPFAEGSLYRTGDLAHFLPDGNIVFDGRRDDQLKIRGIRIEPAEIKAVLDLHPEVTESVIVTAEDQKEVGGLIACVVLREGSVATPRTLKEFLGQSLPAAYVPAYISIQSALPRLANGKIDRQRLAEIGSTAPDPAEPTPMSPLEETIASCWNEILGVGLVDKEQNVFDLGADSLSAMRLAFRLQGLLGVTISIRDIMDSPTIKSTAECVEKLK